jgi:hypothetical protein
MLLNIDSIKAFAIKNSPMLTTMKTGTYFIPSLILPLLIVATIIEEKKEVIPREKNAKILKSPGFTEMFVIANIIFPLAGISTLETICPMIVISWFESARSTGAAMTAANEMNMT